MSALGGPVLVPGVGAQGGRPEDLRGFGGARPGQLLPAVSREILRAGPDVAALRAAAEKIARRGGLPGMTPYDVAEWAEFANTVAGGAAALAGLMFVGLSLNLTEVLAFPGVAARAAATLGLTVAMLVIAVFVGTPGQDNRVLAAEIGFVGLLTAVGVAAGTRQQQAGPHRNRALLSMLLLFIPGPLLLIGAISLWCQAGGGLYWVTAAVAMGFASATGNAWVLLVEIKRSDGIGLTAESSCRRTRNPIPGRYRRASASPAGRSN